MSLAEKYAIILSLGGIGTYSIYTLFFQNQEINGLNRKDVYKIQQDLSKKENIKLLYSTMSFFYLQGFEQKNVDCFMDLYDILQISKPNFIALNVSSDEYQDKYQKVLGHPLFKKTIDKVDLCLKTKNTEELKNIKDISLKNLQNLYVIDYCQKKKCQIVYAKKSNRDYQEIEQYKQEMRDILLKQKEKDQLQEGQVVYSDEEIKMQVQKQQESDFVDNIMELMKPQFSLLPSTPYKTIIGLVDPPLVQGVGQQWRNKFNTVYGHQILDEREQQILENQRLERQKQLKEQKQ